MKRNIIFLLILFLLVPVAAGFAQTPVRAIDTLAVELWPDYDRKSVLVMLTGTLASGTRFPAAVTLPIPETAQINAVARIDGSDGHMKDDIASSRNPAGTLTFITSDLGFRVEYYVPYTVNYNQRSFDFTWLADLSVKKLQLTVQRPISASVLNTEPAAENIVKGEDGFSYYTFSTQDVPAGETVSLHVDYTMTVSRLSVANLPPPKPDNQKPGLPAASTAGSRFNWGLVIIFIGGLIVVVSLIWHIASRRSSSRIPEPVDTQVDNRYRHSFCPNCGEQMNKSDKFCSGCGTKL